MAGEKIGGGGMYNSALGGAGLKLHYFRVVYDIGYAVSRSGAWYSIARSLGSGTNVLHT